MQTLLFEVRGAPINGERVVQAREFMGMTQTALADLLFVDQTLIAHIERGTRLPSAELLSTLAEILGFPEGFFRQRDGLLMPKGSLLFRSKAVVGRRAIAAQYQHSRLAVEFAVRLAHYAELLPVNLPQVCDPIEAARAVRANLGLGSSPFPHVLRGIETLGVLVVPLTRGAECDGFATWAGNQSDLPVISIASGLPFDRHRLTAAHELGHIILHKGLKAASKEHEEEAYAFAAELLLPADAIVQELSTEKVSLFLLAALKAKWKVSMQAIARRARELQVISDRQYRYLMMQVSQRGWRTSEPESHLNLPEKPRAIAKLVEVAMGANVNWQERAIEFGLSAAFIEDLLSGCDTTPRLSRVGPSASDKPARERRVIAGPRLVN